MDKSDLLFLHDYADWADERLLEAAAGLEPAQYLNLAGSLPHGSLHATLVHILAAEWIWRQRCLGNSPTCLPAPGEYAGLVELRPAWQAERKAMRSFLAACSEADLKAPVHYRTTRGQPCSTPLWQLLLHVANHGTQHRAEAAMLLTAAGHSPGDLDVIVHLREKEAE
jgi:uncharacterized damage-inducible protein DinB